MRISSYDAPFSADDVDLLHAQGEAAMEDLLRYDLFKAHAYARLGEKDNVAMFEVDDDQLYTVKGSVTIYTHLAEVLDLLNTRPPDYSYVLSRLLGGLHAINRILHPKTTTDAKGRGAMLPSDDEDAMLVTWLAVNAATEAASAKTVPAVSREFCFLRYSGYFNHSEAGVRRVLPDEPLSPTSMAVSVWDSIDFQPVYINASIGRLVRSGFLLTHTSTPNAVQVHFLLSSVGAHDKTLLQRIVRSTLLNLAPTIMELRLFKDQLLLKSAWGDGSMCTICLKAFTFLRRKHHCRLCGDVFCATCSIGRSRPEMGDSVRVCASCIEGNPSSMMRASDKLFSIAHRFSILAPPRRKFAAPWPPRDEPPATTKPFDIPSSSSHQQGPQCDREWVSQPGRRTDRPLPVRATDVFRKQSLPEGRKHSVSAKDIHIGSAPPVGIDPVFEKRFEKGVHPRTHSARPVFLSHDVSSEGTSTTPHSPWLHDRRSSPQDRRSSPHYMSYSLPPESRWMPPTSTPTESTPTWLHPEANHTVPSPWTDDGYIYESTGFDYPLNFRNGNPWPDAPLTATEAQRLEKATALDLLRRRDDMALYLKIACKTAQCPIGTLCVVGGSAGLLLAKIGGVSMDTLPRHIMLESHAIMSSAPTIVLDCKEDLRFALNPLVNASDDVGVRFYLGIPLTTSDDVVLGVLSLVDTKPRDRVRKADIKSLVQVADTIMARIQDTVGRQPEPTPVDLDID
ncbi:hypothetical protein SPRG_11268 [Saprolegnia parasitica CBS 223.65]|uniref:FYVE-type domain-containing protein n=1 Tax=Saprolegnia parasitica (strain CBS 223.65) TaxID=695850 RepID=A0A067CBD1_SAPPC|nr:hypothetical protein SPRG_11268 [Saprolegnia parasitica CBS 223.65]KDO23836.1 hypothetical protein SPRG_11268 [Saprolegnia parasitica CBS 223.65]|eukprot:XP_012205469.1 hypothetical protein SPRG_11268 [Saprolegnia parasitica CBS 223.65]